MHLNYQQNIHTFNAHAGRTFKQYVAIEQNFVSIILQLDTARAQNVHLLHDYS